MSESNEKLDVPVRVYNLGVYDLLASGKKCIGFYWERKDGTRGKYTLMFNPNSNTLKIEGLSNKEDDNDKVFLRALLESMLNQVDVCN